VPNEGGSVGGLVYALPHAETGEILRALDEREQGGYDRVEVRAAIDAAGEEITAITWIARPGNPWHLGPAPLEQVIADVLEAKGPSGTNVEYVLRLEETLRALEVEDDHVTTLARALREALGSGYSTRT